MDQHQHHVRSRFGRRDAHHHHNAKKAVVVVTATADATQTAQVVGFVTLGKPEETSSSTAAKETTSATSKEESKTKEESSKTSEAKTTSTSASSSHSASSHAKATSSTHSTSIRADSSSISSHTPTTSSILSSSSASATLESSSTSASVSDFDSASSTLASPTSTNTSESSSGLSGGATAGIVGGLVGLALILGVIGLFIYRRKAQQKKQEAYGKPEDEKDPIIANAASTAFTEKDTPVPSPTTSASEKAPRVSLRPVTQGFFPNLNVAQPAQISANNVTPEAGAQRQMNGSEIRKPAPPALVLGQTTTTSKEAPDTGVETPTIVVAPPEPSPVGSVTSQFTDIAATPGGPQGPTSPVHRVQMDYKKSMPDELELRAGQLVRIMHEYDDGWVLCIRLDRSQQGVCPRTCLSQRPVKPRPHGPPGSPASRGPPGAPANREPPGSPANRGPPGSPASRGPPMNRGPPGSPANRGPPAGPMSNRSQSPAVGGSPRPYSPSQGPVRPYSPTHGPRPQSPSSRPQSPGYQRPVYRPSTPERQPQSPTPSSPRSPPQIVVSPSTSSPVRPASPGNSSPTAIHKPAIPLARPSPLSNQTSSSDALPAEQEANTDAGFVFHAM